MTGERLAWFRVASHLHTSVEELTDRITFSEFLGWLDYLNWFEARHGKEDFYLAQIAAEIRRGQVKHPKNVKTKDFLIQASPAPAAKSSKSIWLSVLKVENN